MCTAAAGAIAARTWPSPSGSRVVVGPGAYEVPGFFAPFRITLTARWLTFGSYRRMVDLSYGSRYIGFLDYGGDSTVRAVVGRLRRHPWLRVAAPRPARVGGHRGFRLDATVRTSGRGSRELVSLPSIGWRLERGYRDRIYVLDVGGKVVTIDIQAPADEFPRFVARAERELAGLRFVR